MKKDFLCLSDWSGEELEEILDFARKLKTKRKQGEDHPLLAGKTLAMIFEKSSTRTRISFEAGMYQLGGHALFLDPGTTQIGRGEPLKDTARVLSRYLDGIMIRTFAQKDVEELAKWSDIPIINGLTDRYHPCQLMADLLTVMERRTDFRSLTYCWIGDGNNMANSWINAAAAFGFELRVATPPGYEPDQEVVAHAGRRGAHVSYGHDPFQAARGAHVLNTDVWASMGQESEQQERQKAFAGFQINRELVREADPEWMLLHCLPAHRGEEVTDEILESKQSVVFDQAENRLHVQKAILSRLMA